MGLSIKYVYDSEYEEFEAKNKGYRNDVIVEADGQTYKMYITDITRLRQDVESEIDYSGYYQNEPNMIIVKEVTKDEIERTIFNLYKYKFFESLGSSKC